MIGETLIWLVGIQCKADDEAKFNTWYDDIHVPMLLKGDHVKKVTRFKLADKTYHVGTTTQVCPNYLTIYEFESQDQLDSWMNGQARAEAAFLARCKSSPATVCGAQSRARIGEPCRACDCERSSCSTNWSRGE